MIVVNAVTYMLVIYHIVVDAIITSLRCWLSGKKSNSSQKFSFSDSA